MKTKRLVFELCLIGVIAVLLAWKFWPEKNSASTPATATTMPAPTKTVAVPATISKAAVEVPKLLPVQAESMPGNLAVPGNGSVLYEASKARAAAQDTDQSNDKDYAAIVKGSPGLAKLDNQMTQDLVKNQVLASSTASTVGVGNNFGRVNFTAGTPVSFTLKNGEPITVTATVNADDDIEVDLIARVWDVAFDGSNPRASPAPIIREENRVTHPGESVVFILGDQGVTLTPIVK